MTDKRRFEGEWVKLENLISKAKVKRCGSANYPVLSMTMHDGIVEQVSRFKKTIASKDTSSYKIVEPGQLVVGFPIDEGVIYVQGHDFAGIMSPAYNVWDIDRSKIHPAYLELALHSTRSMAYYADKMRGTTARRRSITDGNLLALEIPLPTLQAQNEIVSNLHQVNEIAAASKRRMEVLDDIVKSRFIEMFGDPITNDKHFPQKRLSDIATIKGGYAFKSSRYAAHGIRIIRISNVQDGFIEDKFPAFYSESSFCGLENYLLDENDLLMSLTGNVGRVGMLPRNMLPAALNQRVACIKSKDEALCLNRFLFELFRYPGFIGNAERNASGMAQKNMSTKWLQAFNVMLPPLALQQEFADFVTQVDKLRFDVQQQIEKLETLKQSLMQEYFG